MTALRKGYIGLAYLLRLNADLLGSLVSVALALALGAYGGTFLINLLYGP